MKSNKLPRGLRNNNPFNIKKSSQPWKGKITILPYDDFPSEQVFEVFSSLKYGVRAGLKLLYNYVYLYKLDTVYKVLERFAPRCENALDVYVEYVENTISNYSATKLHQPYLQGSSLIGKRNIFFIMCYAIIRYENGINDNVCINFHLTPKALSATFDEFFPNYTFKNY